MAGTNGNGSAPAHATLTEALVAAQADMPAVEANAVNPHFKSKFVSLGHLMAKVRPVLNRHGIAVAQFPSQDANGKPTLVTVLLHGKSGERLEYAAPLMLPKADPQGQGSAITYMRRYALAAALGISDQEDDDGHAATSGVVTQAKAAAKPIDLERANEIGMLISEAMQGEHVDASRLSEIFTQAGVTARQINREAVAALTTEQADRIAAALLDAVGVAA
jgi:ABC-type ATPase with predicted acetyltransferase domain